MKVRVPMLVQDPMTAKYQDMPVQEGFDIEREDFFLDGPVTRRVAILDLDPETGELLPGAAFLPPPPNRVLGHYRIARKDDIYAHDFNQVSVFATVLKTMYMFEEEDNLGRPLTWAFDGPQLLVVPRAGRWANAFYERDSRSLQFFFFANPYDPQQEVYTSLSRDVVAHETGHAILDGIAPHLYNAITPQSLALHEAIADLTALLIAFRSANLREAVLNQTGGSIENSTAFSSLAEEFGRALDAEGRAGYLRSLLNQRTLDPNDTGLDSQGKPNRVVRNEPHLLSEVLSGALYTLMVRIHNMVRRELAERENRSEFEVSGKALWIAGERFKRMILRALDYLPPGEISFADYGRAILAADQASHPDDDQERNWIRQEFVRRHMAPSQESLEMETNFEHPATKEVNLQALVESDWAAYEFANRNRALLGIPAGIPFHVEPRLDVRKLYYHREGKRKVRECIFKVWWNQNEENSLSSRFPRGRQITVGTTLAMDWYTGKIRALLSSDHTSRPEEQEKQQSDRDEILRWLADEGQLQPGVQALGPEGKPYRSIIQAQVADGLMRVRGAARLLHILTEV